MHTDDLHELLYNSRIMPLVITKLNGEYQNIKQQTLNILLQIATYGEWIFSIIF